MGSPEDHEGQSIHYWLRAGLLLTLLDLLRGDALLLALLLADLNDQSIYSSRMPMQSSIAAPMHVRIDPKMMVVAQRQLCCQW